VEHQYTFRLKHIFGGSTKTHRWNHFALAKAGLIQMRSKWVKVKPSVPVHDQDQHSYQLWIWEWEQHLYTQFYGVLWIFSLRGVSGRGQNGMYGRTRLLLHTLEVTKFCACVGAPNFPCEHARIKISLVLYSLHLGCFMNTRLISHGRYGRGMESLCIASLNGGAPRIQAHILRGHGIQNKGNDGFFFDLDQS
jgi:hypothetical protein